MRKLAMTRGPRFRVGLALAASASMMLCGFGTYGVYACGLGTMTLEERVAALTAEFAQLKAENARLRESQRDTSGELSHILASLANAEIGISALRTTIDENEAHRRQTAAQIAFDFAWLKNETVHLRKAQNDTATEIGSLRAGVANSEIGLGSLRATTGEIRQQIERIEAARDATGSIFE